LKNVLNSVLLAGIALFSGVAFAQSDLDIVPVRGHIYLLAGAGGDITLSIGTDGVFLVDSGRAEMSDQILAAITKLSHDLNTKGQPSPNVGPPKPIRYIANTTIAPDHTGGNLKLGEAGTTYTGGNVAFEIGDASVGAAILSHENALQRLSDAKEPSRGLPTETYFGSTLKLSHFFNGEGVELIHIPNATTDGDSIVYFRGSDVISAGDILDMTKYPYIDMEKGGSIQGVIAGLNKMLELVIAEFRAEGGTRVIPGHGRICETADLAYYRDMVTIIRDRVQDMIKHDMTLDQVKAAKPTEDWDPRFGKDPTWTPDKFVEAVYKSLNRKQ
jgi:cyclase